MVAASGSDGIGQTKRFDPARITTDHIQSLNMNGIFRGSFAEMARQAAGSFSKKVPEGFKLGAFGFHLAGKIIAGAMEVAIKARFIFDFEFFSQGFTADTIHIFAQTLLKMICGQNSDTV
jgi:hypothetical protein